MRTLFCLFCALTLNVRALQLDAIQSIDSAPKKALPSASILPLSDLHHSGIVSFETKKSALFQKVKALQQGQNVKLRILHFGDSHTAGEYMSDATRKVLQKQWGNGGIGWIFPSEIKGQRQSQVAYQNTAWQTVRHAAFGGASIRSNDLSYQQVSARKERDAQDVQQMTVMVKAPATPAPLMLLLADNTQTVHAEGHPEWQLKRFSGRLPFTLASPSHETWEIGLIHLENQRAGVIYSALGINGAQFAHWQKWGAWPALLAQTQADLVILAYGTNEAFAPDFNAQKMMQTWRKQIRQIKQALPNASILIVGAPEALLRPKIETPVLHETEALSAENSDAEQSLPKPTPQPELSPREQRCGVRPKALSTMQQVQYSLAQQEHTLFWSWENAMSEVIPGEDPCLMQEWMAQNLASKDGVHFSSQGYQEIGRQLAEALLDFIATR